MPRRVVSYTCQVDGAGPALRTETLSSVNTPRVCEETARRTARLTCRVTEPGVHLPVARRASQQDDNDTEINKPVLLQLNVL